VAFFRTNAVGSEASATSISSSSTSPTKLTFTFTGTISQGTSYYLFLYTKSTSDIYGFQNDYLSSASITYTKKSFASRQRVRKAEAQQKATYDYILADMIGRSISRIYNSSNKLPDIGEVYPTLFDLQEIEDKRATKKAEMSAIRFRQFAETYNKKYKSGGGNEK